ncbi:MAG: DNA gyrase subunit A [Clostridia bacterium]|nr:DNA gyrase subunit A [Clostridia bacterium]
MADLLEDRKIVQHEIYEEMKTSFIDYSMSVIVARALPDVRDGLKPVHRRILYGLDVLGITPDKPHKKSARIVGEVMGKYHPHGDASIYDAMVRLAQPWNMRYPLVDPHGNFGSMDGDGAAASRYTEARMAPFALEMLRDIDEDTVDYVPNYDGEEKEPVVLPSRFPNLLVNGANGIAVGMATSIPPHNLREVIDGTIKLIDNPNATVDEVAKCIKGPDFPTGATIVGKTSIKEAYRTGQGKVRVRAKYVIEEGSRGTMSIIFTEIPYGVNKASMIAHIADLVRDKKLEGIKDIRDESSKGKVRVVIDLKKDANPKVTLNRLYKHTELETNISIIMIAIVNGRPQLLNLKDILVEYIAHQKEVLTRRTKYRLGKAEARAHIVQGLLIAIDNIDEVIKTIRESYDDAKERLMERFNLSAIQAQAILDMQLKRLQGLEKEKLEAEYQELLNKIAYYKSLLADEHLLMGVVKDELTEIRNKWGDPRRTEIVADEEEVDESELIEEENVVVTVSHLGYIKRVSEDTYRTQKRGGKGVTGLTTRENDFVKHLVTTSTHDHLMFFTNMGKVYNIKAYEIPEANRTAKGTPAVNFLNLLQRERIQAVINVKEFSPDRYLMVCTRQGNIKKMQLSEFDTNRKAGLIAIKLHDGDDLIAIKETTGEANVIIITKKGKCISFREEEVRAMGRTASGVRAITLEKDDEVVSMELASKGEELLVVTEKGYGKRTPVKEYKLQSRGGKGLLTYDKTRFDKTGYLVGAMTVLDDDEIFLINSDGIIIRIGAGDVSKLGRTTQGVRIMKVDEESEIVAMAKSIREEDEPDPETPDPKKGGKGEKESKAEKPEKAEKAAKPKKAAKAAKAPRKEAEDAQPEEEPFTEQPEDDDDGWEQISMDMGGK